MQSPAGGGVPGDMASAVFYASKAGDEDERKRLLDELALTDVHAKDKNGKVRSVCCVRNFWPYAHARLATRGLCC